MATFNSCVRISVLLPTVVVLSSCARWYSPPACSPAAPQEGFPPGSHDTPPASAEAGATWRSPVDGMVMVYVPAGEFIMGASSDDPYALDWETPAHTVFLDAYWIDSTEVTNAMYAMCVADGACTSPMEKRSFSRSSYYEDASCGSYPVIHVTWQQAHDYCQWAGRRLPTEAEWEKAARGTDCRIFPWGNDQPTTAMANLCGEECRMEPRESGFSDGFPDTAPVGFFTGDVSPYGAYDVAGNVAEWVADRGQPDYYSISPERNPGGPSTGETRVIRGGFFGVTLRGARLSARSFLLPTTSSEYDGFRCAVPAR